jgi:hypothetical protein
MKKGRGVGERLMKKERGWGEVSKWDYSLHS